MIFSSLLSEGPPQAGAVGAVALLQGSPPTPAPDYISLPIYTLPLRGGGEGYRVPNLTSQSSVALPSLKVVPLGWPGTQQQGHMIAADITGRKDSRGKVTCFRTEPWA